jgi:drug/metabolite transporter (DMT)-like permease
MSFPAGEVAALSVSVFWTFTALAFEYGAKRIGSLALNVLRLVIALAVFTVLGLALRGEALPLSAGPSVWFWLGLSGLVGFVFGDIFLFQAYADIGARLTQVLFSASPLITALLGFAVLGERLSWPALAGMVTVVGGIALVVSAPPPGSAAAQPAGGTSADAAPADKRHRLRGVVCALLGALGQSGGLILSKIGAPSYDPFAATQIRVVAGLAGFLVLAAVWGRWSEPWWALAHKRTVGVIAVGAFFGPFLGVSLALYAAQRSDAGVAATLMGLTPILILVPAVFLKREKVALREFFGAALAVAGSALLFVG